MRDRHLVLGVLCKQIILEWHITCDTGIHFSWGLEVRIFRGPELIMFGGLELRMFRGLELRMFGGPELKIFGALS